VGNPNVESIHNRPDLIEKRLRYARHHIPELEYRRAFKQCKFYPDKDILVSLNGKFALSWREKPEVIVGKQNIGSVQFLMLDEVKEALSESIRN